MQAFKLLLLLSLIATVHSTTVPFGKVTEKLSRQASVSASLSFSGCISFVKPYNRPTGTDCACGNQCASKSCKEGVCRCRMDAHCPDGFVCILPPTGWRTCALKNGPLGSLCFRDKQCASDKCERRRCVCSDNGDCPNGHVCKKPIFSPNFCQEAEVTNQDLGEPCSKNKECASGKCEQKACVCNDDGDCPSGEICMKPIFKKNYCVPAGRPLGDSCTKNSQCASKKCEKKECVCNDNADCPSGKVCKKKLFKKNECV